MSKKESRKKKALERWLYHGDVNLEYGGAFIDLAEYHRGYCNAVVVDDLGSNNGWQGSVEIRRCTIQGTDGPGQVRVALRHSSSWIGQILFDPHHDGEEPFQQALWEDIVHGEGISKDIYADWLEERGDDGDARDLRKGTLQSWRHEIAQTLLDCGHWEPDWEDEPNSREVLQLDPNGPVNFPGLRYQTGRLAKRLHNTTLEDYVISQWLLR